MALPAAVGATVITRDAFKYNDGSVLVGQGGWQAHSAGGSRPILVTNAAATVVQSTLSGEDVNKRWFTPVSTTVTTYASFNLVVPSGGTIATQEYFAHFRPAPTDTNGFVSRVFVGTPATASTFTLSISNGTTSLVAWGSPLNFDTQYKVVISYDPVSGQSRLWVNPVSEGSTNVITTTAVTNKPLESFALRQATAGAGTNVAQVIGDFVVASTFNEVNASPKEVPASAPVALALAATLLAGGAMFVISRRRTV